KLKWSFSAGDSISSSPVVDSEGTVYVGSWDKKLYAVDSGGKLKWSYETGASIASSPSIGADGTVYVGSDNGILYAIGK
ncbi:MAG: outer membrane protein assembly factor BamB family protein, partial [Candidatus Bathyanammoxibius sp.]